MRKERIIFREWMVFLLVILCVGSFFIVSLPLSEKPFKELAEDVEWQEKVKVYVSGAVLNPGEYEVKLGSSLKSVLNRVGFESFADKRAIYTKKTLVNSCEIFVPEKSVNKKEINRFKLSK